jgi:putative ABC transport system permease protein
MIRYLGWHSDREALGKSFVSLSGKEKVIGVFQDFNAGSLHTKVSPLVLNMKENPGEISYFTSYLVVRYAPGKFTTVLPYVRNVWDQYVPERPFEFKILEEELKNTYKEEDILFRLSAIFTALVILIATLGLYGLAAFTVYQRTKEISVRRILGANFIRIVALLSREFNLLVLLSIVIAWPLTYLAVTFWFNHFAYHVRMGWLVYFIGGMMAFIITMLVTIFKTFLATRSIPVEYLKYE